MALKEIFDQLRNYKFILVTGPQRAGTTIAAAMIADHLNIVFYPDEIIGQRRIPMLNALIAKGSPFSLQCPALLWTIDQLDIADCAVTVMRRSTQDITNSIHRIKWGGWEVEFQPYSTRVDFDEKMWQDLPELDLNEKIGKFKYGFWEAIQKPKMKMPFFELEYETINWHRFWLDKEHRKNFSGRQISKRFINSSLDAQEMENHLRRSA